MYTFALIRIIPSIIFIMLFGRIFPWWSFSIITFIIGYSLYREKESIIYGFLIGFFPWFILLIYAFYNSGNDDIFFKMSNLIIGEERPILLIMLSSLLSGILGSLSSWTGFQFNKN